MQFTQFGGLTALDENDPIAINGGSFLITNPRVIAHFLQIGAVTHRHDNHAPIPSPSAAITGVATSSGGVLQASAGFAVTYTVTDSQGGETLPAPPLVLSTGEQVPDPMNPPTAQVEHSSGIMPAGAYYYAKTLTDGQGGETLISPSQYVYVDPGYSSGAVILGDLTDGMPAGGTWRLWRSSEGDDYHLVTEGTAATYTDAGFDPPDDPAEPPLQNTTNGQGALVLTLPTVDEEPALASGSAINIYLAPDTDFLNPSFYETLPISAAGTTITITDDGSVSTGSPPPVSRSISGAALIDPDTEMIEWPWKRPVATSAVLPMTGNDDGDMRVTLDTKVLYCWDEPTASWKPGGGAVGAKGDKGDTGDAGPIGPEGPPAGAQVTVSQQAASYVLALTDAGTLIEMALSSAGTLTIPPNSAVPFPLETVMQVCQVGSAQVQVVGGAGVTVEGPGGLTHTAGQWATIGLRQRALDEWVLSGKLG